VKFFDGLATIASSVAPLNDERSKPNGFDDVHQSDSGIVAYRQQFDNRYRCGVASRSVSDGCTVDPQNAKSWRRDGASIR